MPNFEKIAVVGVGLIGASLAAALKKAEPDLKITAVDRSTETIQKAEKLGIIDQGFTEIKDNLKDQDLIFIAVPVAAISTVIREIKEGSDSQQLLVDAGSTKKEIMLQAAEILEGSSKIFIGGHPMAGSHKSGIDWHDPDLFRDAPFILTPWLDGEQQEQKNELLQQLKVLIGKIGANVHLISAAEHDRCTAYLSHLPHLLSSVLVNLSQKQEFNGEFFELSGSGYQDMTRIAGSSAELWQDIILSNRKNLAELIEKYISELKELQQDIENNDQNKIYDFLARAAEIKNQSREK
ncbi:prephenate dehydrogenase [Halanaerobium saccharolyticum]|uniref:Prephenate dehydrogenase n=1 Tax=Halanaerobium saccharolyticum TaxID=43595 RepID=A0A4R7Z7C8_9FIRM|nr:prephenate dehydrogenase/arogenate dehydrogenase family protein [Halanaerobium saccharolyticum]RAK09855.1 prephenate dehydrogenase [Halanaerobium saccharolyticum]TDW07417.1 prephenate dehydrogenase [Halanaerobium saccharolyticum]TDX61296.1 prephenate dehydrogenase [Halanaerobium saccharolyticum]